MHIKLFQTGGTIDKTYNPITGAVELTKSQADKLLIQGRCDVDLHHELIFLKDSLDTSDIERAQIVKKCTDEPADRIIITHGTDTMPETAALIQTADLDKTIVLTGAMVPFNFKNSDALFNLGSAITAVQTLAYGVYIVMGGQVFEAGKVRKNTAIGVFETTE